MQGIWFTDDSEESDLGGDDCEKAESGFAVQLLNLNDSYYTSDPRDVELMGFLASWE